VAIILVTMTWLFQAGSYGTMAYAVFPCMTMLLIATPERRFSKVMVFIYVLVFAALRCVEFFWPNLIVPYQTEVDRFIDFLTTVLASLLLAGFVTIHYVGNYRRTSQALAFEKNKIESLTTSLRRYLPSQLVESLEKGEQGISTKPRRVRITTFFSDIKDFTPLTDSLEPEDLTQLLNDYLTEMTSIAIKWGGTIDKFIGDAMMILFGAPVGKDTRTDALNCVKMAIEMQRRMEHLEKLWFENGIENPLQMRVGIHTGVAAVGDFGASDRLSYTAIGGEVNLASRLEEIATPGGIVISHSTWALVKDEVSYHRRTDKANLKGISRDVIVYDVSVKAS
jgi:class 3 adenylate cyclase